MELRTIIATSKGKIRAHKRQGLWFLARSESSVGRSPYAYFVLYYSRAIDPMEEAILRIDLKNY